MRKSLYRWKNYYNLIVGESQCSRHIVFTHVRVRSEFKNTFDGCDMFVRNTVPSGIGYDLRKRKKVNLSMTLSLLTSLV